MASALTELIITSSRNAGSQREVRLTKLGPTAVGGVDYIVDTTEMASVVTLLLATKAAFAATNHQSAGQQIALPPFSGAIFATVCDSTGLLARHAARKV